VTGYSHCQKASQTTRKGMGFWKRIPSKCNSENFQIKTIKKQTKPSFLKYMTKVELSRSKKKRPKKSKAHFYYLRIKNLPKNLLNV
jgi:hypothetical protein